MNRWTVSAVLFAAAALGVAVCGNANSPTAPTTQPAAQSNRHTTASGLTIIDVKEGKGAAAQVGDSVTVNYTGKLANGTKFDSSYDRNQPFQFVLGEHTVIPGWDEGLVGMKVGGKRTLIIPPQLAYGAGGTPDGTIPPNATLTFDIEMVAIQGK